MFTVATLLTFGMISCGSLKKTGNSNQTYDDNALKIEKGAVASNQYKIKVGTHRIIYSINDRKQLKGLSLQEAKDKVLAEAVMQNKCAMIVEPNFTYDKKGKKIIRITVAGYPGDYNFEKDQ